MFYRTTDNPIAIKAVQKFKETYNKEVLFACLFGSHAYGYASKDSDYDIRIIYKEKSIDNYFLLGKYKDFINYSDGNVDVEAYDIGKAVRLCAKSNVSILNWLCGLIIENNDMHYRLLCLCEQGDKRRFLKHFLGIAYEDYKKLCKNKTVKELRNLFRDLVDIHLAILNIEEKDLFHADSYMDVSFCIDYPKSNTSIRDFMYYDFTDKYQKVSDEVIAKYHAFYLHTKEKADQVLQNTDYEYSDNTLQAMSLHLYRSLLGY